MFFLRIALLSTLVLVAIASGHGSKEGKEEKKCEQDDPFVFYRMMVFKAQISGATPPPIEKEEMLKRWGNCVGDTDDFIDKMAKYVESFDLDGSAFREDPFSRYDGDYFMFETMSSLPLNIVMSTIFDYSKHMNTRINGAGWRIVTKKDIGAGNETIPKGSVLRFGIMRFWLHGREFCFRHSFPRFSKPHEVGQRHVPLESNLQSAEWGSGVLRGVLTHIQPENNIWDLSLVATFPSGE